eukprot:TRINITY_DN4253_c0_g1_i1.p1 TRINITY_DN4253_c0_g1~~TRINITY_DN4253_c0_g1_i1.p1  ORF type:complete len:634 (-),score=181.15 TRINITY_DN4253_c0_g1_i1:4-1905(-)
MALRRLIGRGSHPPSIDHFQSLLFSSSSRKELHSPKSFALSLLSLRVLSKRGHLSFREYCSETSSQSDSTSLTIQKVPAEKRVSKVKVMEEHLSFRAESEKAFEELKASNRRAAEGKDEDDDEVREYQTDALDHEDLHLDRDEIPLVTFVKKEVVDRSFRKSDRSKLRSSSSASPSDLRTSRRTRYLDSLVAFMEANEVEKAMSWTEHIAKEDPAMLTPKVFALVLKFLCQKSQQPGGEVILKEMLKFFNRFSASTVSELKCIDSTTFFYVLKALAKKGDIPLLQDYFQQLKNRGFPVTRKNYAMMIQGYGRGGDFDSCLRTFVEMKDSSDPMDVPNDLTFQILIDNCAKFDRIDLAEKLWEMMIHDYRIEPGINTFTSILEMYGKHDRIPKMFQVVEKMFETGLEPDAKAWIRLLLPFKHHVDLNTEEVNQWLDRLEKRERSEFTISPYESKQMKVMLHKLKARVGFFDVMMKKVMKIGNPPPPMDKLDRIKMQIEGKLPIDMPPAKPHKLFTKKERKQRLVKTKDYKKITDRWFSDTGMKRVVQKIADPKFREGIYSTELESPSKEKKDRKQRRLMESSEDKIRWKSIRSNQSKELDEKDPRLFKREPQPLLSPQEKRKEGERTTTSSSAK